MLPHRQDGYPSHRNHVPRLISTEGSERRQTPAFGYLVLTCPARPPPLAGGGLPDSSVTRLTGSRTPPSHAATGTPRPSTNQPETHVSPTWQPGSFARHTMQSRLAGVFPMLCIGRMERFQRSDACSLRHPAQVIGRGNGKLSRHISAFAAFCITANPCLTISANGATRRSAIPHNRISGRYS